MENDFLRVEVLNYGGTIRNLFLKDQNELVSMVASYVKIGDYLNKPSPYLNALIGPNAGRIAYGKYIDDEDTHQLSINDGKHHLHGGNTTISRKYFEIFKKSESELTLTLNCHHDIDGYPIGVFQYVVRYILNRNTFTIEYQCTPPKKTLLNMTNHMYFNLGLDKDIFQHILTIPAKMRCSIDKEGYPNSLKTIDEKNNEVFNFNGGKIIGDKLKMSCDEFSHTLGFDHAFILTNNKITLFNPNNNYRMDIITDQESVVFYSANYFDDSLNFASGSGKQFSYLALETQAVPNGINIKEYPNKVFYDQDNPYKQKTSYSFSKE